MNLSEEEQKQAGELLQQSVGELSSIFRREDKLNRIVTRNLNYLVNNIRPEIKETIDSIIKTIKSSMEPVVKK